MTQEEIKTEVELLNEVIN